MQPGNTCCSVLLIDLPFVEGQMCRGRRLNEKLGRLVKPPVRTTSSYDVPEFSGEWASVILAHWDSVHLVDLLRVIQRGTHVGNHGPTGIATFSGGGDESIRTSLEKEGWDRTKGHYVLRFDRQPPIPIGVVRSPVVSGDEIADQDLEELLRWLLDVARVHPLPRILRPHPPWLIWAQDALLAGAANRSAWRALNRRLPGYIQDRNPTPGDLLARVRELLAEEWGLALPSTPHDGRDLDEQIRELQPMLFSL